MSAITGDYDDRLVLYVSDTDKEETLAALLALPEQKQQEALAILSRRERQILALRFGLRGWPRYSLKTAAQVFRLSSSRICEIENRAVRKLRSALGLAEPRICVGCGNAIVGRHFRARYCSERCRWRAAWRRRLGKARPQPERLLGPPPPFCDGDPEWHRQWSFPSR
jgi:hypothetical protein